MFAYPALLWFLPILGAVVLIHLINMFRHRRVEWAAMSVNERNNAHGDAFRQYVPSEEMRRKTADLQERGKKLVTILQNRLMNVLTDAQLGEMQKILDETPEFAKRIIAQFKAGRETQERSPVYVPEPNSWRPGDPLPFSLGKNVKADGFHEVKTNESRCTLSLLLAGRLSQSKDCGSDTGMI